MFHSERRCSESEDEKVPWDTQRRDRERRDSERWGRERRDSERRGRERRDGERRDRERRDSERRDRESQAMAAVRGRLTTLETVEKGKVKTLTGTDGRGAAANS